jgi:hypothetical protein
MVEHLEQATGFGPGFPGQFIAETTPWVFGAADAEVDPPLPRRL